MADGTKQGTDKQAAKNVPTEADLGVDVGYLGTKVDPRPNEEYSLESGPDAPPLAEVAQDTPAA